MLYPLTFHPIYKERIWGGRKLEELYGKKLQPGIPVGEAWEISDRPGDISVVANGPLAGTDLHALMQQFGQKLMGSRQPYKGRFPLLIKILDAREKLSLQVHPPAAKAEALGGEPKTEMWYIADADPGADLYVGLKKGVTRQEFETKVGNGKVSECFHRHEVKKGDTMFLPSGRVHAIGSGLVIFEIQQNSDTTYRVFDWNRVGLDGKPRQLHVAESLESIDFTDFEPELVRSEERKLDGAMVKPLVQDSLFEVAACKLQEGSVFNAAAGQLQIIGVVAGKLVARSDGFEQALGPGDFCLLPACLESASLAARENCEFLHIK